MPNAIASVAKIAARALPESSRASRKRSPSGVRIAAHAAIINLGVFCRLTDTVEVCIDKLIQVGANEIQLHPELVEGGIE